MDSVLSPCVSTILPLPITILVSLWPHNKHSPSVWSPSPKVPMSPASLYLPQIHTCQATQQLYVTSSCHLQAGQSRDVLLALTLLPVGGVQPASCTPSCSEAMLYVGRHQPLPKDRGPLEMALPAQWEGSVPTYGCPATQRWGLLETWHFPQR